MDRSRQYKIKLKKHKIDIMKQMTVEEINAKTLSKGMTTANVVYMATRNTTAVVDIEGEEGKDLIDISKGSLFVRSGCGILSTSENSYFKIGDRWGKIANRDVEHYANDIGVPMEEIKEVEHYILRDNLESLLIYATNKLQQEEAMKFHTKDSALLAALKSNLDNIDTLHIK